MSDLANKIVDKMIGGANHLETTAAQALWIQAVSHGVTSISAATTNTMTKTAAIAHEMISSGKWAADNAFLLALQESAVEDRKVLSQLQTRIMELQAPRTSGLFM